MYRQKLNRGEGAYEDRGANAPPTKTKWPQKCGFGSISAAMVWPGGHTRLEELLRSVILPYLPLVFSFLLQDLMKQPLIVGLNHLIWEDSFQLVFNLSDLPRSALIL